MHIGTLCFLAGVFVFQQCPALPDPWFAALLPVAIFGWLRGGRTRAPCALAAGFLYALLRAHLLIPDPLPSEWEGQDLRVVGVIAGLPDRLKERTRFEFDIERIEESPGPESAIEMPWRVRLNWYRDAPRLRSGERWRLQVRLKRPRGFANPGGFDYEGWLFRRGLAGTGYVRAGSNERIAPGPWSLSRVRRSLSERVDAALGPAPLRPLIKALALGMRGEMSSLQWEVLRSTGTAHLMAISGLHVGLVAGLTFGFCSLAWRLPGLSVLLVDAKRVGAGAAIAAAFVYAALAGFSVPTQRAALMVTCLMLAILTRRPAAPTALLGRALLAVLILDPFAVSEAGFWLSFCAVAFIFYGVTGRLALRRSPMQSFWWRYGRIQCLLGIALLPLGFLFFGEYPLVAPLANAFAVPWVSALVVPPVLAGTLAAALVPAVGALLLELGHLALSGLWSGLEFLAGIIPVLPAGPAPSRWQVLAALVGALMLFAPRGTPARWLGALWMAPLFLASSAPVPEGALRVTVLDVGQGSSLVLRTRDHTLVYDTGPRFSDRFDAGAAVVVPYLRHLGIREIDTLVLSHRHQDHVGGAESLLQGVAVRQVMTNVSPWTRRATFCRAGRQWEWNAVRFAVLHPSRDERATGNEGSCVIRVRVGETAVLLTGDIGERSERALLEQHALQSDLLMVPHHGSSTSSSAAFLDAVNPRLAVVSYGYRNRFGLPDSEVMARYRSRGIPVLRTATEGAIEIDLHPDGVLGAPRRYRRERPRYWHWQDEREPGPPTFPSLEAWRAAPLFQAKHGVGTAKHRIVRYTSIHAVSRSRVHASSRAPASSKADTSSELRPWPAAKWSVLYPRPSRASTLAPARSGRFRGRRVARAL